MSAALTASVALAWVALRVGHTVGDHWLQSHTQATTKGTPGRAGALACARHVAGLTATQAALLGLVALYPGVPFSPVWLFAGLAVNAATHYLVDRRTPLVRMADWLDTKGLVPGKGNFVRLGDPAAAPCGTGAYSMDQAWHEFWLLISALLVTIGG